MRRDSRDWLMGFSTSFGVTFLAMMVVLGTVCFLSYYKLQGEAPQDQRPDAYLPEAGDRLTLLVAGTEEAGMAPDTYLLLGFLPDKGKIALCVLPPSTYLEYGGQGSTLGRMWQQGGLPYAQKGLAQYLGIPIDRHAVVETEDLGRLMSYGGLLDYDLAVDLNYTLHGRQIVMPKGRYQLDGRKAMDVISYPAYKGGERERSDRAALLISQIITQNLPAFLTDTGEKLQSTALSVLDTDLSAPDCLQRSAAIQFLARLKLPATTTVFLEGSLSRDYTVYHLTAGCKDRIREMYQPPDRAPQSGAPAPDASQPESPGAAAEPPVPGGDPSSLDSGTPPFQEPQRMESPYVKFR